MTITLNGTTGITTPALDSSGPLTSLGIDDNATSTAITIDASQNVGIGTASPSALLDVMSASNPSIKVRSNGGTVGNYAELTLQSYNNYSGSGQTFIRGVSSASGNSDTDLTFGTNSSGFGAPVERMRIDSAGRVTMPYQPAFLVRPASTQTDIPINAATTIVFATEIFDQNADFASNTFTAPVAGKYQLSTLCYAKDLDIGTLYYQLQLVTSNRTYSNPIGTSGFDADMLYYGFVISVLADMDAGDTAYVRLDIPNSGAAQVDIETPSYFSGYLVA